MPPVSHQLHAQGGGASATSEISADVEVEDTGWAHCSIIRCTFLRSSLCISQCALSYKVAKASLSEIMSKGSSCPAAFHSTRAFVKKKILSIALSTNELSVDADDESLRRYKASLLGAAATAVPKSEDPRQVS